MDQKFVTVPFDLEKAKAIQNGELEGKIVTRDGRNARIICWDKKSEDYTLVALIECGSHEDYSVYNIRGMFYNNGEDHIYDLFLQLPEYLTFKDGDVLSSGDDVFIFKKIVSNNRIEFYTCNYMSYMLFDEGIEGLDIVNSLRLATEPEKQKLINALQESNDPRTGECLKKLGVEVKPKCEFTTGQPVIGVDGRGEWRYDLFSHYKPEKRNGEYVCTGRSYKHCLPYKGNEHLLGTTNSADE